MSRFCLVIVTLSALMAFPLSSAEAVSARAKVTVKVVDENNRSVENARVGIGLKLFIQNMAPRLHRKTG